MRGKLITFEGSEGCGKSTQSRLLYTYLKRMGYPVIYVREPGGTKVSEKIRQILLDSRNKNISPECEMLLYMAARAQIVNEVIRPALTKGKIVISDRFLDSTIVYQGYGLGIDIKTIKAIGSFVTASIKPNLTIFLDLSAQKGLKKCGRIKDRIESRSLEYHQRVRNGYLKLARLEPRRIRVVKVERDKSVTQKRIRKLILGIL